MRELEGYASGRRTPCGRERRWCGRRGMVYLCLSVRCCSRPKAPMFVEFRPFGKIRAGRPLRSLGASTPRDTSLHRVTTTSPLVHNFILLSTTTSARQQLWPRPRQPGLCALQEPNRRERDVQQGLPLPGRATSTRGGLLEGLVGKRCREKNCRKYVHRPPVAHTEVSYG